MPLLPPPPPSEPLISSPSTVQSVSSNLLSAFNAHVADVSAASVKASAAASRAPLNLANSVSPPLSPKERTPASPPLSRSPPPQQMLAGMRGDRSGVRSPPLQPKVAGAAGGGGAGVSPGVGSTPSPPISQQPPMRAVSPPPQQKPLASTSPRHSPPLPSVSPVQPLPLRAVAPLAPLQLKHPKPSAAYPPPHLLSSTSTTASAKQPLDMQPSPALPYSSNASPIPLGVPVNSPSATSPNRPAGNATSPNKPSLPSPSAGLAILNTTNASRNQNVLRLASDMADVPSRLSPDRLRLPGLTPMAEMVKTPSGRLGMRARVGTKPVIGKKCKKEQDKRREREGSNRREKTQKRNKLL